MSASHAITRRPVPRARLLGKRLSGVLSSSALLLVAACTGVRTDRDPDFAFAAVERYAWRAEPRLEGPVEPADAGLVLERLQRAVEHELARRGVTRAEDGAPSVLVGARLHVDIEDVDVDPYYSVYDAERQERARLVLELRDPQSGQVVWRGEASHRLRVAAQAFGGITARLHPSGQRRDWRAEALVERLVSRLAGGA